ncbi:hypothetical protein ABEU20_001061 [Rhodococcus sp. PAM 2766]|uniref:Uncharacterized protein n=1 Tax=Rhodococcus parequi TaxID=3137122 RepID=A0ABW9FAD7_9NOCA
MRAEVVEIRSVRRDLLAESADGQRRRTGRHSHSTSNTHVAPASRR